MDDQLDSLIEDLKHDAKEDDAEEPEPEHNNCDDMLRRLTEMHMAATGRSRQVEEPKKKKPKKSKYLSPEYIIIFDDLSNELK